MKMKYFFPILMIFLLFIYISPLFSQTAKIISGNIEYSQYSANQKDQAINFKVNLENTGSTVLTGLWLNVYVESAGGYNTHSSYNNYTKASKWNLPKLNPNKEYKIGYKPLYDFLHDASLPQGDYTVMVELRDSSKVYDQKQIDSFMVNQTKPDGFKSYDKRNDKDGSLYINLEILNDR